MPDVPVWQAHFEARVDLLHVVPDAQGNGAIAAVLVNEDSTVFLVKTTLRRYSESACLEILNLQCSNAFCMGNKPGHEGCIKRSLHRIVLGIASQSPHRFLLEHGHDARVVHEAIPLCKGEAQLWPRGRSCLLGLDAKPVDVILEEGALDVGSDRQHGFQ